MSFQSIDVLNHLHTFLVILTVLCTGSWTRNSAAVWELLVADGHPFVHWPVESSLFGIHDGSTRVTLWGTHKEGPPLDQKNLHSSLINLYLQPPVHHPVHPHKGKSRYVGSKVVKLLSSVTWKSNKNFSNWHCLPNQKGVMKQCFQKGMTSYCSLAL